MDGWTGQILRVNLTNRTHRVETFSEDFATTWIGGRGFAVKILYDELAPGIDPLGPENKLVVAVGPISGIPAPNTGKTIVAAKSPATGGYGDGNLGTRVTDQIRKAGYDALIVEGRADSPTMLYIEDDRVEYLPADEVWGQGTIATNDWIYAKYGKGVGVLNIGQGGENMVRYATVRSLEGRSGGRPGMGAVMGSKLLKAIVFKGSRMIPQAFPAEMKALGRDDLKEVRAMDKESGWSIQGTDGVLPVVQRGGGPPGPQLPGHPPPGRLDGRRRAGQRGADGHLRLPQLHHALRHRHPRRGGARVGDRLREHRPPRAEPRHLRPRRRRHPQLPVRRLRPGHDLGRQRPRVLRGRDRAGRRRRATSASATPRA